MLLLLISNYQVISVRRDIHRNGMEAEAEGHLVCFEALPQLLDIALSKQDPFCLCPGFIELVFAHVFGDLLSNEVAAVQSVPDLTDEAFR